MNRIDLQIKFCEPDQLMNQLGLKKLFHLDAKYCVSVNINVLLIYQAFKGKFAKEEVAS